MSFLPHIVFVMAGVFLTFPSASAEVVTRRVTRDRATGRVVSSAEVEQPHECYHFTWLGPVENNINDTRSCSDPSSSLAKDQPCFEPLVYTEGPYRLNGPNLTQVETKCATVGNTDGAICVPFCDLEAGRSCVKMTYWRRDRAGSVWLQSHFCGEGVDVTNGGRSIEASCHRPNSKDGKYDIEACFCGTHRCNAAPKSIGPIGMWIVFTAVVAAFRQNKL